MRHLVLLAVLASTAYAQPVATGVEPTKQPPEPPTEIVPPTVPTTVPVDEKTPAPDPREASGVAHEDAEPTKEKLKWIPRTLLFFPRITVWLVSQPFRGAAYAYEAYDIPVRATDATFNQSRTFGVYPTLSYETGFGATLGVRALWRNLFGTKERAKFRVDFGGRYRQAYGLNLRSGDRFGKTIRVELDSSYERRPHERYFGIGNTNGPSSRFRETLVRNVLTVDATLIGNLHSRMSGALMLREFSGTDEDDSITLQYDTSQIPGFDTGVNNVYIEHEFAYDSRRPSQYQSQLLDSTGWYLSLHTGITTGVRNDPSELYSYGVEVQRYFDLYDGSRILILRALAEQVGGDRVSFIDLPRLGGTEYLRGYPNGRFRDNAVALASAEYNWDLGNYFAAYTFVDVGRPYPSLKDIATDDMDNLRVGFGGGIQIHTMHTFLMRLQLAGSRDGNFFVELGLSPAFDRRERAGRY